MVLASTNCSKTLLGLEGIIGPAAALPCDDGSSMAR